MGEPRDALGSAADSGAGPEDTSAKQDAAAAESSPTPEQEATLVTVEVEEGAPAREATPEEGVSVEVVSGDESEAPQETEASEDASEGEAAQAEVEEEAEVHEEAEAAEQDRQRRLQSMLEQSVLVSVPTDGALGDEGVGESIPAGRRALRWLSPRLLGFVLLLFAAAGVGGTAVTLLHPFRDWFMHLMMYGVIFAFFLLYLKAYARRRPIARWLLMLVTVALSGFFVWILFDFIPAQKVWYERSVLWREEVDLLILPIGLLSAAAFFLLLHCTVFARFARRARQA